MCFIYPFFTPYRLYLWLNLLFLSSNPTFETPPYYVFYISIFHTLSAISLVEILYISYFLLYFYRILGDYLYFIIYIFISSNIIGYLYREIFLHFLFYTIFQYTILSAIVNFSSIFIRTYSYRRPHLGLMYPRELLKIPFLLR